MLWLWVKPWLILRHGNAIASVKERKCVMNIASTIRERVGGFANRFDWANLAMALGSTFIFTVLLAGVPNQVWAINASGWVLANFAVSIFLLFLIIMAMDYGNQEAAASFAKLIVIIWIALGAAMLWTVCMPLITIPLFWGGVLGAAATFGWLVYVHRARSRVFYYAWEDFKAGGLAVFLVLYGSLFGMLLWRAVGLPIAHYFWYSMQKLIAMM